jgi:hypothetical protein
MMFGGVSEHFANLQHKKRCNTCVSGPTALFRGYRSCENGFVTKASILLHKTQNEDLECFSAFSMHLECKKMQNLCFEPECTIWDTDVANMVS